MDKFVDKKKNSKLRDELYNSNVSSKINYKAFNGTVLDIHNILNCFKQMKAAIML